MVMARKPATSCVYRFRDCAAPLKVWPKALSLYQREALDHLGRNPVVFTHERYLITSPLFNAKISTYRSLVRRKLAVQRWLDATRLEFRLK
jgi:hypothetical protein